MLRRDLSQLVLFLHRASALRTHLQPLGALQDTEFWRMPAAERDAVMAAALGLVKVLAALLQPYMPSTSRGILAMLNGPWEWTGLGDSFAKDCRALEEALPAGHAMGQPQLLFTEIKEETVAELQARFGGQQGASSEVCKLDNGDWDVCALLLSKSSCLWWLQQLMHHLRLWPGCKLCRCCLKHVVHRQSAHMQQTSTDCDASPLCTVVAAEA